jgi:hypothetical protein
MSVIMSSQQIPGNSETSDQNNDIADQIVDENTSWVSRHRRSLWGIGVVSVAIIIGVSIRSLFREKK